MDLTNFLNTTGNFTTLSFTNFVMGFLAGGWNLGLLSNFFTKSQIAQHFSVAQLAALKVFCCGCGGSVVLHIYHLLTKNEQGGGKGEGQISVTTPTENTDVF